MIIKVRGTGEENSWRFYEAHEVQWSECTYKKLCDELPVLEDNGDVHCEILLTVDAHTMLDTYVLARIAFYDQDNCARHLYTMTTAYLLNDEGKTVDRIN